MSRAEAKKAPAQTLSRDAGKAGFAIVCLPTGHTKELTIQIKGETKNLPDYFFFRNIALGPENVVSHVFVCVCVCS